MDCPAFLPCRKLLACDVLKSRHPGDVLREAVPMRRVNSGCPPDARLDVLSPAKSDIHGLAKSCYGAPMRFAVAPRLHVCTRFCRGVFREVSTPMSKSVLVPPSKTANSSYQSITNPLKVS